MSNFTEGQLTELCQMVHRGAKPCAMMPILKSKLEKAIFIIAEENLNYVIEDLAEGWLTFWVFKRPELKDVILSLPKEPATKTDHYLLGALFGYSNDAICDYLKIN